MARQDVSTILAQADDYTPEEIFELQHKLSYEKRLAIARQKEAVRPGNLTVSEFANRDDLLFIKGEFSTVNPDVLKAQAARRKIIEEGNSYLDQVVSGTPEANAKTFDKFMDEGLIDINDKGTIIYGERVQTRLDAANDALRNAARNALDPNAITQVTDGYVDIYSRAIRGDVQMQRQLQTFGRLKPAEKEQLAKKLMTIVNAELGTDIKIELVDDIAQVTKNPEHRGGQAIFLPSENKILLGKSSWNGSSRFFMNRFAHEVSHAVDEVAPNSKLSSHGAQIEHAGNVTYVVDGFGPGTRYRNSPQETTAYSIGDNVSDALQRLGLL